MHAPVALQHTSRCVRVIARHADQGQQHQLPVGIFDRHGAFGEITCGVVLNLAKLHTGLDRYDFRRLARRFWPVGFHCQARFAPDVDIRQFFGRIQPAGSQIAAIICVTLRVPQGFDLRCQIHARRVGVVGQGITTHFAVITHAVTGVFGHEAGPVTALAQQQKPVVAQAVFEVTALVAGEEILQFAAGDGVHAQTQVPIGAPRLQHMAGHLRQQCADAFAVALLVGLVHFQQGLVASGLLRCLCAGLVPGLRLCL